MEQQRQERPRVFARPDPDQGPAMAGVRTGQAPVRLPEGGLGASVMRGRSVFEDGVRGPGALVREVPVVMAASPVLRGEQIAAPPGPSPAVRGLALAQTPPPPAAQRTDVERLIQRQMPPSGLTRQEAAAVGGALGPAIEASVKALSEGVACGKVDSFKVQEVRVIKDQLDRFAASARPDERYDRLSSDDFAKVDEVLACQTTYEQVSEAKRQRTTALLLGGVVVGALVLIAVS